MPQYIPDYYPAAGGSYQERSNVIDPEVIEREFQKIALAHNTHATQDFASACVAAATLQKGYSRVLIPFGLAGSYTLSGNITLSDNQVSFLNPKSTVYINGAYAHAQKFYLVSATTSFAVNLYKNTTAVFSTPIMMSNTYITTEWSTVYTKADPGVSLAAGDYLHLRASATTGTVLTNVLFFLDCSIAHST